MNLPLQQLRFLYFDLARLPNSDQTDWRRLLKAPFSGGACAISKYRLCRFTWLLLGRASWIANVLLFPVLLWCRAIGGRHEFPPSAQIGPGLRLAHSCLPCVIHAQAVIGANLTLTGSNVIGTRRRFATGELVLGNNVLLGVGALVIGPVRVGDGARLGAGALVVSDVPAGAVMVSPAASARPVS